MEWYHAAGILFGLSVALMMAGLPVAIAFFATNIVAALLFMGGPAGIAQIINNGFGAMTTFALVAGMTPIALGHGEGSQFRAPLGVAVIGGVIASTLLTLLVIPTVYEILADTREWLFGRFRRGGGAEPAPRHAPREHPVPAAALERGYQSAD